jgi:hypothetical protein
MRVHIYTVLGQKNNVGLSIYYWTDGTQEAKYCESWPSTTSAWAGWSRFDIPVDRFGGVHSLLRWPSRTLGPLTCHYSIG